MPVDQYPAYRNRDRFIRYQLHNNFPDGGSLEAQQYQVNKLASPLLRLPSELRLKIYELLLGGRQIHIRFVPWKLKRRVKRSQTEKDSIIKGHFRYEVLPYKQDPWAPGVEQLWEATASSPHAAGARLTLLSGVCRQLYHETALFPRNLNSWSFESVHMMERYILKENRMSLQQRRAVEILYCKERLPRELRNKFKGLKVIIWKDDDNLRWQELDVFPDIAWKDRQELLQRSWRWHSNGRTSKYLQTSQARRAHGEEC